MKLVKKTYPQWNPIKQNTIIRRSANHQHKTPAANRVTRFQIIIVIHEFLKLNHVHNTVKQDSETLQRNANLVRDRQ
jgi:hypothetical protein